ncbi:RNA polymerase factor sigma-54 [Acetobacter okinawensis]|uniref:RNA polymerase factor sigma-54 n=1 Tax=Acetobacter okinawensis TaxID=1076594 RepID=UPI000471C19E|nr:RNA polymerase factor sigma-54 [Acetobacter okinawensis]
MRAGLEQKVRHKQGVAVTPRMREALRLLRLPQPDLEAYIAQQVEQNPFLELPDWEFDHAIDRTDPSGAYSTQDVAERLVACDASVEEQILRQIALSVRPAWLCRLAALLLEEVDEHGRLSPATLDAFCQSRGVAHACAEEARQYLLSLDPVGVGAFSVAECFAVQLDDEGLLNEAFSRLLGHLNHLVKKNLSGLAALCGVNAQELEQMLQTLQRLEPYPYCQQVVEPALLRRAELRVERDDKGEWHVFANTASEQGLMLNTNLQSQLSPHMSARERGQVREWMTEAYWLLNVVTRRRESLVLLGQKILLQQRDFLNLGIEALKPLTMLQIAQDMQVHESTVSRLVADKYISTPDGVLPLRFFFTAGVGQHKQAPLRAAVAARACLRRIVREEKPENPLSDSALVEALAQRGFTLSRRTVVKYRQIMGIRSSFSRKLQNLPM